MGPLCRVALALLIAGSLAFPARAQEEPTPLPGPGDAPVRFTHLTLEDGLSQQTVYAMLQDRHGFMWFGTQDGLNKYDGYRFTVYQHDPSDPNSLSPHHIRALLEDRDGMIWVGTGGGRLSRFDPATETFTYYRHDEGDITSLSHDQIRSLYQDRQGTLWVGTRLGGLNRFNTETETFTRLVPDPEGRAAVWSILEDAAGTLWVGVGSGLVRYDPSAGEAGAPGSGPGQAFTHYRLAPEEQAPVGANWVTALYEDRQGTLWVGGWGLHRFDRETGTFERFLMDSDAAEARVSGVNRIMSIVEDHTGALWIGCTGDYTVAGGGLNRFDRATGTFTRYLHDPEDPGSLNSNHIVSLYEDRQGILWVGTLDSGVSKVDRTARQFTTYLFDPSKPDGLHGLASGGMFLDRDGVLWLGTVEGVLNRFDRHAGGVAHYRPDPEGPFGLPANHITTIHRDRRGRLWVGTFGGGVGRLDETTGRFTRYLHDSVDVTSLSSNSVRTIYEDRDGVLWIGTFGGLNRFNTEEETFIRFVYNPADAAGISGNIVNVIHEDRAGMFWVGTSDGGLNRFNTETETFTRYIPGPSDSTGLSAGVYGLYERPREPGVLWIGTYFRGLYRLDMKTGRVTRHYTAQNSDLPNNIIWGLLGDEEGYLWMSTNRGLVRFNPDKETFEVFGIEDGLQMLEFSQYAFHKGYNGELFFGGTGGVNAIRPEATFHNPHPPEVALTGLRLFSEPVTPGPEAPLKTSITKTEAVAFSHAENDLTIEYAGLHFRHPEQNQYAYMLEGYDEAWRAVGTERRAVYTNLPPGDYTFRVKAANSDGVWNEAGRSLAITIRPPWWRTGWAYALYGLLFAGGVFAVDRVQRRRLIRRERERARERELEQAREIERAYHQLEEAHHDLEQTHRHLQATQAQLIQSEKMASLGQLTAGIAHEIKNPLNFINNFAELNEELADELREACEADPEIQLADLLDVLADLKENAQVITQHGRRADSIVRAMMQHAAGGTGEREPIDVNALVSEYVELAYHGKRAQLPGFNAEIKRHLGADTGEAELVPQEMGRVLLNLLSNAFDAVHARALSLDGAYRPTVTVSTRRRDEAVEIRVSDNGPGIPAEVREKIFEPFYTTKPPGSGTGLGLSLSYDIVAQGHGGTLTVESAEGEGATFIVTLPHAAA